MENEVISLIFTSNKNLSPNDDYKNAICLNLSNKTSGDQ